MLSVMRWMSSGHLMYCLVAIVHTESYTSKLLRGILKCSHHQKETVIVWLDGGINDPYCCDHFAIYICVPEAYKLRNSFIKKNNSKLLTQNYVQVLKRTQIIKCSEA